MKALIWVIVHVWFCMYYDCIMLGVCSYFPVCFLFVYSVVPSSDISVSYTHISQTRKKKKENQFLSWAMKNENKGEKDKLHTAGLPFFSNLMLLSNVMFWANTTLNETEEKQVLANLIYSIYKGSYLINLMVRGVNYANINLKERYILYIYLLALYNLR